MVNRNLRQREIKRLSANLPIFIHVPKTGGKYLTKLLNENGCLVTKVVHTPSIKVKRMLGTQYDDRFSFAFVRNPMERFLSACNYNNISDYEGLSTSIIKNPDWVSKYNVHNVEHFFTQSHFITDWEGNIIVDFLGRYENLKEDIERLKLENIDLSGYEVSEPLSKNYNTILTDKTRSNIRSIYKEDFELLKY